MEKVELTVADRMIVDVVTSGVDQGEIDRMIGYNPKPIRIHVQVGPRLSSKQRKRLLYSFKFPVGSREFRTQQMLRLMDSHEYLKTRNVTRKLKTEEVDKNGDKKAKWKNLKPPSDGTDRK